jgi:pSer/pThr/pTyr-binding forkhead associated (FHA) protein
VPLDPDLRSIRLRISARSPDRPEGIKSQMRELEIALIKPIRLGRIDPKEGVYPEVDLTDESAKEHGVSREHACIFRRGNIVEVEDMGSTNGTLLNGTRLAPYNPTLLNDGDQLQLGNLLIEVSFKVHPPHRAPLGNSASHSVVL